MKNILVAITGGISAYKALDIISGLKANDFEVKVIATKSALKFVTKEALGAISGDYVEEDNVNEITHIDLAKWCDLFLLAPATANTIAKITYGFADNLVTSTYLALPEDTRTVICPAMNTFMLYDTTTTANLEALLLRQIILIEPVDGLLACGDKGPGKLPKPRAIVETIIDVMDDTEPWCWPLSSHATKVTNDSYSFLDIKNDLYFKCEIPIHPHVGSFGIRRKHDVHKGVDLYSTYGSMVKAVEKGVVIEVEDFTGTAAGCPWWNDTKAVYVQCKDYIVVYGEIDPLGSMQPGKKVHRGDHIGNVATVLKKDKGRPMSMLHLELHKLDHIHNGQWQINMNKPFGLLDPTPYLKRSMKHNKQY